MKLSIKNNTLVFSLMVLLSIGFSSAIFFVGPKIMPDSSSYLNWTPQRSFLYPLYLKCIKLFFGSSFIQWSFGISLTLLTFSFIRLYYCFEKVFKEKKYLASLCVILLIISLLAAKNYFLWSILSEQLSLPIFIFFISEIILLIITSKIRYFFLASFYFFLAISCKFQLIILIVPIFVWIYFFSDFGFVKKNIFSLYLILVITLSILIDNTTRFINYNEFSGSKSLYFQLVTNSLFLSDDKTLSLFDKYSNDKEHVKIAKEIFDTLESRSLLMIEKKNSLNNYFHYTSSYDKICWDVLVKKFINGENFQISNWSRMNDFSKDYFYFFLQNFPQKYLGLFLMNIYGFFWESNPVYCCIVLVFFFTILYRFFSIKFSLLKEDDRSLYNLIIFLNSIFLVNVIFNALILFLDNRYLIYGNISILFSFLIYFFCLGSRLNK